MTSRARLLIATTNPGKLHEIAGILHGVPLDLLTLRDVPGIEEPEETGATFADNARLKALHYAQHTGMCCVADDSGLEIDALDNMPGVHSARWHGSDYAVKFERIRDLLAERGLDGSGARFVCALALACDGHVLYEATGTVHGRIAPEPRGSNGFGYDPIFFYPPMNRTLAELDSIEKSGVSHRGQAFGQLRAHLIAHPNLVA